MVYHLNHMHGLYHVAPVQDAASRVLLASNSTTKTNSTNLDITVGGQLDQDLTALWVLVCAFLVFFMQAGFALLEAGSIRLKNVRNILLKNVMDAGMSALAWWAVGSAFAHGAPGGCAGNPFIGSTGFFLVGVDATGPNYSHWLFNWAFSATASTIVSGAVAERTQFRSYLIYTVAMTSITYPVIVHWVWSDVGWLAASRTQCGTGIHAPFFKGSTGLLDFAGSGVVHMVGGSAALVGAIVSGPRIGRFSNGHVVQFEHSNPAQMALGALILWLGWYGFNAGSTGAMYDLMSSAATAAVNTTISTAAGGLGCLLLSVVIGAPGDIGPLINGLLAGAVAITASCALVESYAAFVIGLIASAIYQGTSELLVRFRIDDPLNASPVHLFCGVWGVLASGFFATESKVAAAYGYAEGWGVFYGGGGTQLGIQVLGIVVIWAWSTAWAIVIFLGLNKAGWLRIDKETELHGLDLSQAIGHGRIFGGFSIFECWKSRCGSRTTTASYGNGHV